MTSYVCLHCGSLHGEPETDSSETWWWRIIDHGRLGPFCSAECSRVFRHPRQDEGFTLQQWERLRFYRHVYRQESQVHV